MKQQAFEQRYRADWEHFRTLLAQLDRPRRGARAGLGDFPRRYRELCTHYALARSRGYSPGLVEELHALARRGYPHLYQRRPRLLQGALELMVRRFPRTLRRHLGLFWLALACLVLPLLAMGAATLADPALIHSLMSESQVSELESAYDPANQHLGQSARQAAEGRVAMFGFYILNNIGIGFRSFASGLLLGIGSAVILVFNGLTIGAAAGYLSALGYGATFWPFVSGHAPFELTAIAICGAAGLLLGKALLAPGRRTRLGALRANAGEAVVLAGGGALMLVLAAVIEAFWSAEPLAPALKYGVGLAGWALVALWLALAGRGTGHGA